MPNNDYANEPNQSRSEDIIQSILDNTEYDEAARSRIEYLLIELKNAIEGGGGGGGVTSYSPLTEKPKIDNHTLQAGNNSSSDLGLQTKLTFDSAPTENSTNPVTSGGVYTALGTKANSADVYNKSAVDTALSAKADKSTTYAKSEVDTALSSKQNTISDLSTIRSGAALGATAVQPISGKGLSTNDYTTGEKEKLAGIETQANKTTVDSALSDSSTNPVQNKVVKSALDGKQATLTTAQLAAVNSGITSTDVAQITTNKNNISSLTQYGGGKNHYKITSTQTTTGITYTKISESELSINGTYTASTYVYFNLTANNFRLPAGTWKFRFTTTGTVPNRSVTFGVQGQGNTTASKDTDYEFTTTGAEYLTAYIQFLTNDTVNGSIRIMVRPASISDPTYQPYALSNVELTAKEQVNENDILLIVDWLNSLNRNLSPVYGGISEANQFIVNNTAITLPAGTYTISWVSAAKTGSTVVSVFNGNSRIINQNVSNATDDSYTFTIASACDTFNLYTSVANTISNLKIIASS